jgi:hypothetical protein
MGGDSSLVNPHGRAVVWRQCGKIEGWRVNNAKSAGALIGLLLNDLVRLDQHVLRYHKTKFLGGF